MYNRKIWSGAALTILLIAISIVVYSFQIEKKTSMTTISNYEKEWLKVDSLERQGLPQSALAIVNLIYQKAKKENNSSQLVKAVIHKLKFMSQKEEDAFIKSIAELKNEVAIAEFPEKQILHSMLAELYWQYYQNNRWRFFERTQTSSKLDDIRTWDLKTIVEETIAQYAASLSFTDEAKKIKLANFKSIVENADDTLHTQTTLYDFLAHRAVDFYMNDEPEIIRPATQFTLNNESYFTPAEDFAKLKITTGDSLAYKFHALTILQDLIRFHLNDEKADALVDVDLKRLQFVKNNSALSHKNDLYLNALEYLEEKTLNAPVSSEVSYHKARIFYEKSQKYDPNQSEEFKWDAKKAYDICEEAIKKYPVSEGAKNCRSLQNTIKDKSLLLKMEYINIPGKPFKTLINYKNVNKLFFRIVGTTNNEVEKIHQTYRKDYSQNLNELTIDHFKQKESIKQWVVQLPDDGDFQTHAIEAKIDELPAGSYAILASTTENFTFDKEAVAFDYTVVSNISYINRNKPNSDAMEFYVVNRETGEPLTDAKAQILYEEYNNPSRGNISIRGPLYTTDKNGYFSVEKSDKRRGYNVEFVYKNDHLSTKPLKQSYYGSAFYQGGHYDYDRQSTRTYFFTDRSIYRPGQSIYFKGIVINKNGKQNNILKKHRVNVKLHDANSQQVATLQLTTNEYGTYSGVFTAPSNGLTGQMYIDDGHGSVYFSVEEYKRPKFEVKFEELKDSYRLGDKVQIKGAAKAYSGANIDNALVQYRVVRQANYPFRWYRSKPYYPTSPEMEILNGITNTNENGEFIIDFSTIPDFSVPKDSKPIFTYIISADITDANGETRSNQQYVRAGYTALEVAVKIPDLVNREEKNSFPIFTTNLNGQKVPTKGKVIIYKLKNPDKAFRKRPWEKPDKFLMTEKEFHQIFPNDEYDDENNFMKWEKEEKVLESEFDTSTDSLLQTGSISGWKTGRYVLEIQAKDKFGDNVKEIAFFTLFDKAAKKLPYPSIDYLQTVTGQGEPGEKANLLAGSSESIKVLYELEQNGQVIEKQWIVIKDEQRLLEIPLLEEFRGNVLVNYTFVKNNRLYNNSRVISVPYSNKQLDISFETFRNKLQPGEKEQWKLKIKGKQGEKAMAEMVATLYDASLDAFRSHNWEFNIYEYYTNSLGWNSQNGFEVTNATVHSRFWNDYPSAASKNYPYLNWFGFTYYYITFDKDIVMSEETAMAPQEVAAPQQIRIRGAASVAKPESLADAKLSEIVTEGYEEKDAQPSVVKSADLSEIKSRTNFNETAFFYPHLQTDEEGNIIINFTVPEALTRWKMLGFSHTTDLKYGLIQNELVTQKDLMITTSAPRFFREGDKVAFTAKVENLLDKDLSGSAELFLFDALTMKPADNLLQNTKSTRSFQVKKGQSSGLSWDISIPSGMQAVTYKVVASAYNFSDGEEMTVPVLTNRMLVTETMPITVRGGTTKTLSLEKLVNNNSTTLTNHKLTLEYTSNPAWYAIQALPYLMEYPYECAEQVFSRYYANSLASHIANANPTVKQVLNVWKNTSSEALISNLEKNQELKNLLLEETPWVRDAQNDSERKRRIGVLFDLNKMSDELGRAIIKLSKLQLNSGAWPWFEGMQEDRYITQHIATGLGHLQHLGVRNNEQASEMLKRAVEYLDSQIVKDYQQLKQLEKEGKIKMSDNHLSYIAIHYLYSRSFFKDFARSSSNKEASEYFKSQAIKYWNTQGIYLQGMIALVLHRSGENAVPASIIKSLREKSLASEELGMHWKQDWGYYWYQAPVETQSLLIEVFDEVAKDAKAVEEMKIWLLKQKQTQNWRTTRATADATYALLLKGSDWLSNSTIAEITVGKHKVDPGQIPENKTEAGTGYFKTSWVGSEIRPEMGKVTVSKAGEKGGTSWGALYWQYFEQLDKITAAETPLKLKKQLFIQKNSERGPVLDEINEKSELKPGDLIKVRIELRVDRNMEYVHMKDMRASGFEPVNVLSHSKYQDGLWYYESTRDAATNFFFSYLPKGTYVFEYPLRVTHKGDFSNGVTTIQCMYAPEFASHSEGIRVKVK